MNDICCKIKMDVTYPPWGTLAGFFHPKFYSKCEICDKKYLYTWNSHGFLDGRFGYQRRELTIEDIRRKLL